MSLKKKPGMGGAEEEGIKQNLESLADGNECVLSPSKHWRGEKSKKQSCMQS